MRVFHFSLLFMLFFINSAKADINSICVTIKPLHSLVAAVTKGISTPCLIIDNNHSLHEYMLKPSDAGKISNADIIFLTSYDFEIFMKKISTSLAKKDAVIIELGTQSGIDLLASREDNIFDHNHDGHHHHHGIYDYHVWLDPDNAIKIVNTIEKVLSTHDRANAHLYKQNAYATIEKLNLLNLKLKNDLARVADQPFLVFHDAYQYLEKKYHLSALGAITVNAEKSPGAKTIAHIKKLIKTKHAKCIFSEPQFPKVVVKNIAKASNINTGILDAEWEGSTRNPEESYFSLMLNLKDNLISCLGKTQ